MANVIEAYKPIYYANEALGIMLKTLGFASRIYKGYEAEWKGFGKGDTVSIRRPSTGTVTDGLAWSPSDVVTEKVTITLDRYKKAQFAITDLENLFTGGRLVTEHIAPQAIALAEYIDADLATNLPKQTPWSYNGTSTPDYAEYLALRKVLRDSAGSLIDRGDCHLAINSDLEAKYLGMAEWKDSSLSKDIIPGSIGLRAGIQPFVNQSLGTYTSGTLVSTTGADVAGTVATNAAKGAESIALSGLAASATIKAGDSFVIAGNTQRYVVMADATLSTGAATVSIAPPLVAAVTATTVVTFENIDTAPLAASNKSCLLFHRNFAALVVAPLPMIQGAGANMAVVTDPLTGISLRSRIAYDNHSASLEVTLDVVYGFKAINPNYAVVYRRP